MTGNEYVELAMRTNDGNSTLRLRDKLCFNNGLGDTLNGVLGLEGEAGELADLIKKWIFHEHDIDLEHIKKEIGDVMWYIALICSSFGFSLDEIMQMNIDKLRKRYPEGFSSERSLHRAEGDI